MKDGHEILFGIALNLCRLLWEKDGHFHNLLILQSMDIKGLSASAIFVSYFSVLVFSLLRSRLVISLFIIVNFIQTRVIWEEGTLVEGLSPSDCP